MQMVTRGEAQLAMVKVGLLEAAFAKDAEMLRSGEKGILERDQLIFLYEGLAKVLHEAGWALATALDGDLK